MTTTGKNLPAEEEKEATVTAMFDRIAPRYDLVNRLMTFRLDVRWRRKSIQSLSLPNQSIILQYLSQSIQQQQIHYITIF